MIGSNLIETPRDIVARSQARTAARNSADDKGNPDSFNDILSGAERSRAADEQASAIRRNRTEPASDRSAEQADGPVAGKDGKPGPETAEGEETGAEAGLPAAIAATLPGAAGVDPTAAAATSDQAARQPQAGLLAGSAARNADAAAGTAAAAGMGGEPDGLELPQMPVQAGRKAGERPSNAASPTAAEKPQQPDAGAALKAAASEGQAAKPAATQQAAAPLWGTDPSVGQQQTARSEFSEVGLMGRPSGDSQIGDHMRAPVRETAQPAQQVAIHIVRATQSKQSSLRINLYPKELGQVDVTMEMQEGRLKVTIMAERPDALQQLQQGARALERALQEAGLNIGQSDFHFASRDGQSGSGERQAGTRNGVSVAGPMAGDDREAGPQTAGRQIEGLLDISL